VILSVLACLPALPSPPGDACADWLAPGAYSLAIAHDGRRRTARVDVPRGPGPRSLVVNLHGYTSSAEEQLSYTAYDALALAEGFVVAHPQGTGWARAFNGGDCCGAASDDAVDDVGFLDALAAELDERLCVDEVLATGMSNGAIMAQAWACESAWPDAVVSVAGSLEVDRCAGEPLPVLHVHGTADTIVPYAGGVGNLKGQGSFLGVKDTLAVWQARNGCSGEPEQRWHGEVLCERWSCVADTWLCTVYGGGHQWPGAAWPLERGGFLSDDWSATEQGWAWFQGDEQGR